MLLPGELLLWQILAQPVKVMMLAVGSMVISCSVRAINPHQLLSLGLQTTDGMGLVETSIQACRHCQLVPALSAVTKLWPISALQHQASTDLQVGAPPWSKGACDGLAPAAPRNNECKGLTAAAHCGARGQAGHQVSHGATTCFLRHIRDPGLHVLVCPKVPAEGSSWQMLRLVSSQAVALGLDVQQPSGLGL